MRKLLPITLCLLAVGGCNRPATAPGKPQNTAAAPRTVIRFREVTREIGLNFVHDTGAAGKMWMPESVGPGCAFLDADGDGLLDVFLVNSRPWSGPSARATCRLYLNRGASGMVDAGNECGVAVSTYGMGCAVGDYDNDGRPDLFLTSLDGCRLFRNVSPGPGKPRFTDVTAAAGLATTPGMRSGHWPSCAAWFDYDRDGLLDLFVGRYVRWTTATDVPCTTPDGLRTYCGPTQYAPGHSALYRNLGKGRFTDVSRATGIDRASTKALGVVAADLNEDGWIDLAVANDLIANTLFFNQDGRRFEESAHLRGFAVGDSGAPRAGMGLDIADARNDGGHAFAVGHIAGEGMGLYEARDGFYADGGVAAGLTHPSLFRTTFGLSFLDADGDGWIDLLACNGHIDPQIERRSQATTYRQQPLLYRNEQGRFQEATVGTGLDGLPPILGRGMAVGDYDNDGRPDVLLAENGGPARLLRNETPLAGAWLGVRLKGVRSNRDGYGAVVKLEAGGLSQRRWVRSGVSYLSENDPRALFGVPAGAGPTRLEVRWPSGAVSRVEGPAVGQYHTLTEPAN